MDFSTRSIKPSLILGFVTIALIYFSYGVVVPRKPVKDHPISSKVPVDLFVMSKCPDAVFCEDAFTEVVKRVGNIIDLDINFIGKLNHSEPKFGVTCKHGESECLGNVQELCARKVAPDTWYQFLLCLNEDHRKIGLPESNLNVCLKRASVPYPPFKECVENGEKLLKTSVSVSKNLGMSKSCTILINKGEYKCVHDGKWKKCEHGHSVQDFVNQICHAYQGPATPLCQ